MQHARHAWPPAAHLQLALTLVLCSCTAIIPSTDSAAPGDGPAEIGPRPDRWRASDGPPVKIDGSGTTGDGPRQPDGPKNVCSPLPAGCLCAQACSAGTCDNAKCPCQAIPGASYGTLSPASPCSCDPSKHADMNLLLRKKQSVSATKGLVSLAGATDTKPPPQLYTLFGDERVPSFPNVYQLEYWDWGCTCFKGYLMDWEVTLTGMTTTPGEIIRAPHSGYDIGGGHTALVLYAAPGTITLKYTADDNVVNGYTVHLSGICVEPGLQALYNQSHAAGRGKLPALKGRQPLGRASSTEIQAAIRDTGSWMDPRSKKDWWQGK